MRLVCKNVSSIFGEKINSLTHLPTPALWAAAQARPPKLSAGAMTALEDGDASECYYPKVAFNIFVSKAGSF